MNKICLTIILLLLLAIPARSEDLVWPVACDPGKTCWIQQYPDHVAGSGAADFTCGAATYDGHTGTDIRLRDTQSSADVRAALPGTVKATRDGVADHLVRTTEDRHSIANMECGNGVVLDHGNGLETQYCHLRQGSITVTQGDTIRAGDKLGTIGFSGDAAFPHLHFEMRQAKAVIDPFSAVGPLAKSTCEAPDKNLWANANSYTTRDILRAGFASSAVDLPALEDSTLADLPRESDWPALVGYVWIINLHKGDAITVTLYGPQGVLATNTILLDRNKAQYLLYAGKKRQPEGWPTGTYRLVVDITAADGTRLSGLAQAQIQR